MDSALMYLLGFLTEEMWIQALNSANGIRERESTQAYAQQVYDYYPTLGWSEKTYKQLGIKK